MSDRQVIDSSSSSSSSEITARRGFLLVFPLLVLAGEGFRCGWGLFDCEGGFLESDSWPISSSEGLVENFEPSSPMSTSESSSPSDRCGIVCLECWGGGPSRVRAASESSSESKVVRPRATFLRPDDCQRTQKNVVNGK